MTKGGGGGWWLKCAPAQETKRTPEHSLVAHDMRKTEGTAEDRAA